MYESFLHFTTLIFHFGSLHCNQFPEAALDRDPLLTGWT